MFAATHAHVSRILARHPFRATVIAGGLAGLLLGCNSTPTGETTSAQPAVTSVATDTVTRRSGSSHRYTYERREFVGGGLSFDVPEGGSTQGLYELAKSSGFELDPKTRPALMQLRKSNSIFSVDTVDEPANKDNRELQPARLSRLLVLTNNGAGVVRQMSHHDRATWQRVSVKIVTLPDGANASLSQILAHRAADDEIFSHLMETTLVTDDHRKLITPEFTTETVAMDDRRDLQNTMGGKRLSTGADTVDASSPSHSMTFIDGQVRVSLPKADGPSTEGSCIYTATYCSENSGGIAGSWRISGIAIFSDRETPYWPDFEPGKVGLFREVTEAPELSQKVVRTAYVNVPSKNRNLTIRVITSHPSFATRDGHIYEDRVAVDDQIFNHIVESLQVNDVVASLTDGK